MYYDLQNKVPGNEKKVYIFNYLNANWCNEIMNKCDASELNRSNSYSDPLNIA